MMPSAAGAAQRGSRAERWARRTGSGAWPVRRIALTIALVVLLVLVALSVRASSRTAAMIEWCTVHAVVVEHVAMDFGMVPGRACLLLYEAEVGAL